MKLNWLLLTHCPTVLIYLSILYWNKAQKKTFSNLIPIRQLNWQNQEICHHYFLIRIWGAYTLFTDQDTTLVAIQMKKWSVFFLGVSIEDECVNMLRLTDSIRFILLPRLAQPIVAFLLCHYILHLCLCSYRGRFHKGQDTQCSLVLFIIRITCNSLR